ncbi:MAG TPA: glycerol-3-phosphate dehydrogenase C-terminal domain-containing protein, partial [Nevskiaceae bacterium]|nr:glycerol-3-phosphate dehydrogenase C-terminal domain-containing protein [Nevskiaceae bacterium]
VFFVIPWYGRTLVGTTEQEIRDPAEARPTAEEISYLIAGVRSGLPGLKWSEGDVIGAFSGVRTLQAENEADLSAVTREFAITEPKPGLILPIGGKYTTSRGDAADIVDRVFRVLKKKAPPSRTHALPLPGAPAGDFESWRADAAAQLAADGVDAEAAQWLALRHGTRVERIHQLLAEHPSWRDRIHHEVPFIQAEAVLAVRDEMALSADDIARRRMPLSLLVRDNGWKKVIAQLTGCS